MNDVPDCGSTNLRQYHKNFVTMVTWCLRFVHPWSKDKLFWVSFHFPHFTEAKFSGVPWKCPFIMHIHLDLYVCKLCNYICKLHNYVCKLLNKLRNWLHLLSMKTLICMLFQTFHLFLHLFFPFVAEHPCWQHFPSGSGWVGHEWKRQQSWAFCHEVVCRVGSWWRVCYSNCVQYTWTA